MFDGLGRFLVDETAGTSPTALLLGIGRQSLWPVHFRSKWDGARDQQGGFGSIRRQLDWSNLVDVGFDRGKRSVGMKWPRGVGRIGGLGEGSHGGSFWFSRLFSFFLFWFFFQVLQKYSRGCTFIIRGGWEKAKEVLKYQKQRQKGWRGKKVRSWRFGVKHVRATRPSRFCTLKIGECLCCPFIFILFII